MSFSRADARWLSETAAALHAARTPEELHACALAAVHTRLHSIISMCESANHDGSQFVSHRSSGTITYLPNYAEYLWDNPNIPRLLGGDRPGCVHLREHATRAAFERTEYFNALARPNRLHDQILTAVWDDARLTTIAINRDRVFSADERSLLGWMQAHLAASLKRVTPAARCWPEGFGHPWIALTAALFPAELAPAQAMVLQSYFPAWRRAREPWPAQLRGWLERAARTLASGTLAAPVQALRVESARGQLVLRYYPATPGAAAAVHLTEWARSPSVFQLRHHGLTARECEVLHWIAQGKRDAEIAAILACSPATVGKHVENLLRKLHAENRGTAVSTARALLGGG